MSGPVEFYRWDGDAVTLNIKVQPRAERDDLGQCVANQLKVRISAPPVDGKANAHLIKFLAKLFKVPRSRIEILSGESSRDKRVRIRAPKQLPSLIKPE